MLRQDVEGRSTKIDEKFSRDSRFHELTRAAWGIVGSLATASVTRLRSFFLQLVKGLLRPLWIMQSFSLL